MPPANNKDREQGHGESYPCRNAQLLQGDAERIFRSWGATEWIQFSHPEEDTVSCAISRFLLKMDDGLWYYAHTYYDSVYSHERHAFQAKTGPEAVLRCCLHFAADRLASAQLKVSQCQAIVDDLTEKLRIAEESDT